MRTVAAVLGVLALSQPCWAQTVTGTDFLIKVPDGKGGVVVESTTLVPHLTGTCFEWRLQLKKSKGDVAVTEVFILPDAPLSWGDDPDLTISADGRSATSQLSLTPEGGWIGHDWCVTDGDPVGRHSFEVKSGARLLHRFVFKIEDL
jgi:hypothetical protein